MPRSAFGARADRRRYVHEKTRRCVRDALRGRDARLCGCHPLDVLGEQPLLALDLLVVDGLAVLERTEPVALDAAEMDEHVLAVRVDDEPEPLLRIEPLDVASRHGKPPTENPRCARATPDAPAARR